MTRIAAVARLTVMESVRKRVFLALGGFGAALVVLSALFPALDPASQVVLLQAWAYRLILLFGVLVAVVLASFSVPEDIEERRIQTLLSKPVRRTEVLLGKYLGFLGVMGVFFFVMGLFGLALVRIVAALGGLAQDPVMTPDVVLRPAAFAAGPEAQTVQFAGRPGVFEKVEGPLDRGLAWRFEGVTTSRFGALARGRVKVRVGAANPDPARIVDTADVLLEVANAARPGGGAGAVWSRPIRLWYGRTEAFDFPAALAEPGGTVVVRVRRTREETWMAGNAESVELRYAGGALAFEWNFAKCVFLLLMQSAIILSLTLAASLFTSSLVSLLAGGFFFLCGSLVGFLREALVVSESVVADLARHPERRPDAGDVPAWMLKGANAVTSFVLDTFPDLSRLDCSPYLVAHTSVPLGVVFGPRETLLFAWYLLGPLVLACLIARRKEFR